MLNDHHINFGQKILQHQFPGTEGLIPTLLQHKKLIQNITSGIQIIPDRGNNWILASTVNCDAGVIQIFDSVY